MTIGYAGRTEALHGRSTEWPAALLSAINVKRQQQQAVAERGSVTAAFDLPVGKKSRRGRV
jgi:hypothetical protein